MLAPRQKNLLLVSLALSWVVAMLAALWWFEMRYIRPFDGRTQLFSGQTLKLPEQLAATGTIRVVHFWDPGCPCNVGNQQHLAQLLERYVPRGVQFYALRKAGSHGQLPQNLIGIQSIDELPGSQDLPASPAVAIWDRDGQLAYFGPYSEGALCSSDNSFIEPILEALVDGRSVRADSTLAVGCFCDWQGRE